MRILRAERGLVLLAVSSGSPTAGGALLELQARVGHERVASARTAILESLAVLRDVPEERLAGGGRGIRRPVRIGASSQAGLAGTINHYEFLGFRLAGLDDLFTAIAGLTPSTSPTSVTVTCARPTSSTGTDSETRRERGGRHRGRRWC